MESSLHLINGLKLRPSSIWQGLVRNSKNAKTVSPKNLFILFLIALSAASEIPLKSGAVKSISQAKKPFCKKLAILAYLNLLFRVI